MIEVFDHGEIGHEAMRGAMECVARGGTALHVYPATPGVYKGAPRCFEQAKVWAHLLDDDAERLAATARRLGVRRIHVSRRGIKGQHIDMCGKPLERAMREGEEGERKRAEAYAAVGRICSQYTADEILGNFERRWPGAAAMFEAGD